MDQESEIPIHPLGFKINMDMSSVISFDLIRNHLYANIFVSSARFSTYISLFQNALLFLNFQMLEMQANQITAIFYDTRFSFSSIFSNCSECCHPSLCKVVLTPSKLHTNLTSPKKRHSKKIQRPIPLPHTHLHSLPVLKVYPLCRSMNQTKLVLVVFDRESNTLSSF